MNILSNLTWKLERKKALMRENFDLSDYVNQKSLQNPQVKKEPFPHIVIDNFFTDDFYQELKSFYQEKLKAGSFLKLGGYGGLFTVNAYTPGPKEGGVTNLFHTIAWNNLFSEIFHQKTNLMSLLSFHYHEAGDFQSHVHTDYAEESFVTNNKLKNGVIFSKRKFAREGTFTESDIAYGVRKIAIICYLNDNWGPEDNGKTCLHDSFGRVGDSLTDREIIFYYQKAQKTAPLSCVEPKGNRVFAFVVSPTSFHSVEENNKQRFSIAQWLYADSSFCEAGFTKED